MNNIDEMKKFALEGGYPIIKDAGLDKLLEVVKERKPKKILEIGTAIGYSGCLMLLASDAVLDTVEHNADSAEVAKVNFGEMGLGDRVNVIVGDAGEVIDTLTGEYDLIFLDGPKGQYVKYYDRLIDLLGVGGVLVADNVLFRGYVRGGDEPRQYRSLVRHLREFIDVISHDDRVDSVIYDVGDGVSVSIKKG